MRAVVVALGKIGLPLATQIARAGHEVVGCDIDVATVELVNAAQPPFPGEDGLGEALAEVVGAGRLHATTDTADRRALHPCLSACSGAFALRDVLAARGAEALAIDPLYDDAELRALGFEACDGREAAGAILQADQASYTALGPEDLPGVRAIVDGRGLLDGARFAAAGVALRRIGGG